MSEYREAAGNSFRPLVERHDRPCPWCARLMREPEGTVVECVMIVDDFGTTCGRECRVNGVAMHVDLW